jgi:hypothetical protein
LGPFLHITLGWLLTSFIFLGLVVNFLLLLFLVIIPLSQWFSVYFPNCYHLWVHLSYSPCVLIFITWVFVHLNVPRFMFQSLSFELEFILIFPTLCFKPCCLNFCPSWFIPFCFNPHHLSLSSSLSRCTIKCFIIVTKQCFFPRYYLFKCM